MNTLHLSQLYFVTLLTKFSPSSFCLANVSELYAPTVYCVLWTSTAKTVSRKSQNSHKNIYYIYCWGFDRNARTKKSREGLDRECVRKFQFWVLQVWLITDWRIRFKYINIWKWHWNQGTVMNDIFKIVLLLVSTRTIKYIHTQRPQHNKCKRQVPESYCSNECNASWLSYSGIVQYRFCFVYRTLKFI